MPLASQERAALQEFKKHSQRLLGSNFLELRLFGSRARGEGNEESDLDVLVLVKDAPASLRAKIFEISSDILLKWDIDISPLVMSKSHFDDMKHRERLLTREIERDGQTL